MTINQVNDLVRGLVGEDDYHHMKGVLAGYYDIAQRQIATTVSPIVKSFNAAAGAVTEIPDDTFRLLGSGVSYTRIDDKHIIVQGDRDVSIKYCAYPSEISELSDPDTEFEICEHAQNAIPYFAAAYAVLSDSDMRRYYAFLDMYNTILSNIAQFNQDGAVMTVVRMEDM